jgi:hypothetical protein
VNGTIVGNPLSVSAGAAKNGAFGFQLVDNRNTAGPGPENYVGINENPDVTSGDFYLRAWIRFSATNNVGRMVVSRRLCSS